MGRKHFRSTTEELYHDSRCIGLIDENINNILPDNPDLLHWHKAYLDNHKDRFALDLSIVRGKVKQGLSILEVGVCPPLLTAGLKECGYEVKGVDLDPERYRSAISCLGLDVTKVDIEVSPLPFESCFFDAVIFNEVFEHLRVNPIFTLRELNRVLKPCGLLIMSTPNLRSIGGILNLLLRGRGYSCATSPYEEFSRLESVGHMGHVREYTVDEVIEFLDKVGFDCVEVCFRGQYRSSFRSFATTIAPSLRPFCSYFSVKL